MLNRFKISNQDHEILSGHVQAITTELANSHWDIRKFDITKYDKVVIGSPIWNDRLSAPINTVISMIDTKDIEFILYSASGKAEHAKEKIKELYKKEPIILKEPKKHKEELEKLKGM